MNIGQALVFGQEQLAKSDSPYLDSRLLLEHITQYNHTQLLTHPEDLLDTNQANLYCQLIDRAAQREPIPYLLGRAPFFGNDFYVNTNVLIPRQETELLVEKVLQWVRASFKDDHRPFIVDVGTGSGCIAITLARELRMARIAAVDLSRKSLAVARRNAHNYSVLDRIAFHSGSLLDPIQDNPDLIVANLPYVADHEWANLDDGVKLFEPELALRGGIDGLKVIGLLINQAKERLNPGGGVFLEIGWQQGPEALELALSVFPEARIDLHSDMTGLDRIMSIFAAE